MKGDKATYWFKRKALGWGWAPATREGWFVILLYVIYLAYIFKDIETNPEVEMFVRMGAATIALILVCYKTGEKPKWTWKIPPKE